jgi:hypothetical protein
MAAACLLGGTVRAESQQQWAVIVAVQKHDDARLNLQYTLNDAKQVRETLLGRAGLPADHILEMTDESPASLRPTHDNLRREIGRFLARAGTGDRMIVFFSGHGFLVENQTYLVSADTRPSAAAQTALPTGELREMLRQCRATTKFLILDCCHAGGGKALPVDTLSLEKTVKELQIDEERSSCVVLASCKKDETSWEWPERRASVFTYWLCRALEGGADTSADGILTADAVYKYTHERVKTTVSTVFSGSQEPVRAIGDGVPSVLSLRPEPPETLCRRLAEHLDLEVRARKLNRVGVLEFIMPFGRSEGLAPATLPAYCAEKVRGALRELAHNSYSVLSDADTRAGTKDMVVEELGDPRAMRQLSRRVGGLDALVSGTLRRRGPRINLQCELVATADGNSLATPGGMLPLSEDLAGMIGSGGIDNTDRQIDKERPSGGPYDPRVVGHATQSENPVWKEDFPFKLEIWSIDAKPGEPIGPQTPRRIKRFERVQHLAKGMAVEPRGSDAGDGSGGAGQVDAVIGVREGELLEIRVWNNWSDPVAMTLLVDGINTLGQKRERLGNAWSWVLERAKGAEQPQVFEGWYPSLPTDLRSGGAKNAAMKRFQITDAARSVAGRQHFGESIGLITAAFYAPFGRGLGMGEGPEEKRELKTVEFKPGRLLGVINIRYVDEQTLKR